MSSPKNVGAIIVAAGRGTRMGGIDKCALSIHGCSLLKYSVVTFAAIVDTLVVVVAANRIEEWRAVAESEGWLRIAAIVAGGATRMDSVRAGLEALGSIRELPVIAVHDGARPLVTAAVIRRCIERGSVEGAAIAAVPLTDTVKRVREGFVVDTPDRTMLWAAQTPQVFRTDVLQRAFDWADAQSRASFTDEAAMVEAFGHPVAIVPGERSNIKVTEPADKIIVEALLGARMEQAHD